jgi:hypothetical protein
MNTKFIHRICLHSPSLFYHFPFYWYLPLDRICFTFPFVICYVYIDYSRGFCLDIPNTHTCFNPMNSLSYLLFLCCPLFLSFNSLQCIAFFYLHTQMQCISIFFTNCLSLSCLPHSPQSNPLIQTSCSPSCICALSHPVSVYIYVYLSSYPIYTYLIYVWNNKWIDVYIYFIGLAFTYEEKYVTFDLLSLIYFP